MTEGRDAGPEIRVAIVGVGNCAASLVQGVHYYRAADPTTRVPGLMHVRFGDYHVGDLRFVEDHKIGGKALADQPAVAKVKGLCGKGGHLSDRIFERDQLQVAYVAS